MLSGFGHLLIGSVLSNKQRLTRGHTAIIPNHYAGGGVAVGVSGKGLEGYLPSNGLLASLGLGMIAAAR
jgi:fumarate reductase flavoprotein subunit